MRLPALALPSLRGTGHRASAATAWTLAARLSWVLPAIFLLLFLLLPLFAILDVAGPTVALRAWEKGRLAASLRLGALTSALALAFGMPLAWLLGRHQFRGRSTLRALVTVPFVMPVVVMAAGILAFLGPNGVISRAAGVRLEITGTLTALLIAHTIYNVPLVVRLVGDTWANLDPRLEEAAATLGAGPWARFARVTLPRLMPAISAAALLSFLFGFTAFGTVLMLGNPIQHGTIEVAIYHLGVRLFELPKAATLALLQLGVTFLAAAAYTRLVARAAAWERPVDAATALAPLHKASRPLAGVAFLTAAALLLPLAAIPLRALDTPDGWGLGAFARVFDSTQDIGFYTSPARAAWNSMRFALLAVALALPLGALAAHAASRARRGALADAAWMLPLGASSVTLGLGLLVTFPWSLHVPWPAWWPHILRWGFELDLRATAAMLVLAHTLVAFPFVVRTLVGPMRARDPAFSEVARTLGAHGGQRLLWLHAPLLGPALLVGAVLAASVSLGEFGATLVIVRPEFATIPAEMYRLLSTGRPDPWLHTMGMAMATLLLALNVTAFLLLERFRPGRSGGF